MCVYMYIASIQTILCLSNHFIINFGDRSGCWFERKWRVRARVCVQCVVWYELIPLTLPPPSSSSHQHYQQYIVITLAYLLEKWSVLCSRRGNMHWNLETKPIFPHAKMFAVVESKSKHSIKCQRLKCWAYHFTTLWVCVGVFSSMEPIPCIIWWWNHIS